MFFSLMSISLIFTNQRIGLGSVRLREIASYFKLTFQRILSIIYQVKTQLHLRAMMGKYTQNNKK